MDARHPEQDGKATIEEINGRRGIRTPTVKTVPFAGL